MAIIVGIVGFILFLALLGAIINLVKWLFRVIGGLIKIVLGLAVIAGAVALIFYVVTFLGVWVIPILLVAGVIWLLMRLFGPEPLAVTVKKIFHDCEMATYGELMAKVRQARSGDSVDREELLKVVSKYLDDGKLATVDFEGKDTLYRWTEDRVYPNGVQTKHLRID